MAEESTEYEKKPLLAEEEDQLTVEDKKLMEEAYTIPPPPAYEPPTKPVVLPTPEFKVPQDGAAAMPLPTYDQSEKYEKEGVLELGSNNATPTGERFDGTIRIFTRYTDQPVGTWTDFIMYFIVCLVFSWVGYIFACCLALTIAAHSGAIAGLGMSLIIKTIFVEFQPGSLAHIVQQVCAEDYYYDSNGYSEGCSIRAYNFLRLAFWLVGFLGLFLFARGLSVFCHTRGRNNTSRT